jgi:hypothetical protein
MGFDNSSQNKAKKNGEHTKAKKKGLNTLKEWKGNTHGTLKMHSQFGIHEMSKIFETKLKRVNIFQIKNYLYY